jgi:hypothetical protein
MVTNRCNQAMLTSVACNPPQLTGNLMKRSFSPLLLALLSAFFLTSLGAVAQTTVSVTTDVAETTEGVEPGESTEPVETVHQVRQKRDLSTSIALASLAKQDVTDPTVEQVDSAVSDVNAMRASGMGWGVIANSLGLRLGDVVSASRKANKQVRPMAKTGEEAADERLVAKRVREALPAQSTVVASTSASTSTGTSTAGERAARGTAKGSASSGQGSNVGGSKAGGSGGKAGGSSAGQSSGSGGSKGSGNSSGSGKGNSNSSGGGKGGSGGGKGGGNNGGGHGGKR